MRRRVPRTLVGVALATALLAGASVTAGVLALPREAGAHVLDQSLAATSLSNFKVDVYRVSCATGTASLTANVRDRGGVEGVRLSVQVLKASGTPAASITAPDGGGSASVIVGGGAGTYFVLVTRSGGGSSESYRTVIDCRASNGTYTSHSVTLIQNQ
jgi:hypothetical protein